MMHKTDADDPGQSDEPQPASAQNSKENWDDLRYVLAVAETGSVSKAARELGVNHATVIRRVGAFEEAHGTLIFERSSTGYAVLAAQLHVIERARTAARAMDGVARALSGGAGPGPQCFRITSTDTFCFTVLPPILARLQRAGFNGELHAANHHVDLGRLAADISVRPAARLPHDLTGTEAAMLGFAAYRAPGGAQTWLGLRGALGRASAQGWLEAQVPNEEMEGGSDSFITLREMAAAGMGTALLPCILGDGDGRLKRLPLDLASLSVPIWVASHVDLADAPRLTMLREHLAEGLRAEAQRLGGWG